MRSREGKSRLRKLPTEKRTSSFKGMALITYRTQQEVADILGITRQAVQQIERLALRKIRIRLKEHKPF